MTYTLLNLHQLPSQLLPALADLHLATMPTLLANLGQPFVLRYYQLAQKDPSVIAFCALTQSVKSALTDYSSLITDDCLLAYALGSPNPPALNAQLRQPLPWFAGQMLRLAFTHPAVLWQLVQSVFSASEENTLLPREVELTYIGVAPSARGQGLGKTLLTAFVDAARSAGYKSVVLSVETDNPAAIALYTKFGFTIIKTFSEGRYHRHRMEYQIRKQENK
jgi:ribosomal protein S18 acetylase RimI-like enzyme